MKDRKFKIFFSHIHEEKQIAICLKAELEKLYLGAVEIFVSSDDDGIRGGDRWLHLIEEKLKESEIVLVLVSPESVKRPWINFEAGGGWFIGKRVIPLCIHGMTTQSLPEPLHSLQGRNLQEKVEFERLIADIAKSAELMKPDVDINVLHGRIASSFSTQKQNAPTKNEEILSSPEQHKPALPTLHESSAVFFEYRVSDAFPGVRGLKWFNDPKEAVERLLILFKQPLRFRVNGGGEAVPIWWWRGTSNNFIERFGRLSESKCLMNIYELEIERIAVYRDHDRYRNFIYLESKPDLPTGLYEYPEGHISKWCQKWGYYNEEYALFNDTLITRAEYDDGAAVIGGKVMEAFDAELRARFLSKYNFLVAAHSSAINSVNFDNNCKAHLNGILAGTHDLNDLIGIIEKLPVQRDQWD